MEIAEDSGTLPGDAARQSHHSSCQLRLVLHRGQEHETDSLGPWVSVYNHPQSKPPGEEQPPVSSASRGNTNTLGHACLQCFTDVDSHPDGRPPKSPPSRAGFSPCAALSSGRNCPSARSPAICDVHKFTPGSWGSAQVSKGSPVPRDPQPQKRVSPGPPTCTCTDTGGTREKAMTCLWTPHQEGHCSLSSIRDHACEIPTTDPDLGVSFSTSFTLRQIRKFTSITELRFFHKCWNQINSSRLSVSLRHGGASELASL